MSRPGIAILVLLLAGGVAAGFYAVRSSTRKPLAEAGQVVHPERRPVGTTVNATGTVRLRVGSEVRVGSQLSGIVKRLNVTVGSRVREGDVIAEIDDAPVRARLAQAEAQADLDRASLERARVNFERAQQLESQGLIPAQQEQDLELAFGEAKARYEKSLRDRDLVQVDLRYVAIRAPITGTVSSVSTQEGETVAAAFTAPTFVTIIGDNALQLVAMVDETDIANVKPGNPAAFTVDSYPSRDFPGIVESVAPKATIVSGVVNYEVTINIRKDAHLLKPDMTANVSIQTAQHMALLLPAAAVQRDGDQSFVYVQGKDGTYRRPVVIGSKETGMVEIKRGISSDENVLLVSASGTEPVRSSQSVP
ncbi:MAG TPA: efflux RND transporter periplasmic adaptor subunit [Terriglobales bacterium]|jgi:RND family efflux transporter MFP subunit|nr:efflux RND transporter periplasmic adaptor subunit [Terriglobales bacterium]